MTEIVTAPLPDHTADLELGRAGALGLLRLHRQRAINALSLEMIQAATEALAELEADPAVRVVALDGAGERGLCAGGDVVAIRRAVAAYAAGDASEDATVDYWRQEYRLDAALAACPKPVVAFMDGVTMGGGLGLSAFAARRLVTPRSRLAMPETVIGFFPDVGVLRLLARAPGETGTHLALTGATIGAGDAIAVGLADECIEPEQWPAILEELAAGTLRERGEYGRSDLQSPLLGERGWIDECYAGNDAGVIIERLLAHPDAAAREAGATIAARSPWSVVTTLEAIRRARSLPSLQAQLDQDLALARAFVRRSDFSEGVRARLVDKDDDPHWADATVSDIPRERVLAAFDD